jgi:hypothetical protein
VQADQGGAGPTPPVAERGLVEELGHGLVLVDQAGAGGIGRLPVVRAGEVDLELGGERLGPVERAPAAGAVGQDRVDRGAGGEVGAGRGEVDLVGHADRRRRAVDLDGRPEVAGPSGEGEVPPQQSDRGIGAEGGGERRLVDVVDDRPPDRGGRRDRPVEAGASGGHDLRELGGLGRPQLAELLRPGQDLLPVRPPLVGPRVVAAELDHHDGGPVDEDEVRGAGLPVEEVRAGQSGAADRLGRVGGTELLEPDAQVGVGGQGQRVADQEHALAPEGGGTVGGGAHRWRRQRRRDVLALGPAPAEGRDHGRRREDDERRQRHQQPLPRRTAQVPQCVQAPWCREPREPLGEAGREL